MKTLLALPANPYFPNPYPPSGIALLGAIIRRDFPDTDLTLFDGAAQGWSTNQLIKQIIQKQPDIIGISGLWPHAREAGAIAAALRQELPGSILIAGGLFPSSRPEQALQSGFHYAVQGEGDLVISQLIKFINSGKNRLTIPGVWRSENHQARRPGGPPQLNDDLSSLPIPAWDLLPLHVYWNFMNLTTISAADRFVPIITSRGCPGACSFCYRITGQKHRTRSAESVQDEITVLKEKYSIRELQIIDESFATTRSHVNNICEVLKKFPEIKTKLFIGVRPDTFTKALGMKMKNAGIYHVSFGIESGSAFMLHRMNKHMNLNRVRRGVRSAVESQLITGASFVIGHPGESIIDLLKTIFFACSLPLHHCLFATAVAFPGTSLYKTIKLKKYENSGIQLITGTGGYCGDISYPVFAVIRIFGILCFYANPLRAVKLLSLLPRPGIYLKRKIIDVIQRLLSVWK